MAAGLIITVCEDVKKPIFSNVQLVAIGNFSEFVERIGDDIESDFAERGYITSRIRYNAFTTPDAKVVYTKDSAKEQSQSHEEFHLLLRKAELRSKDFEDPAKGYFMMLNESAATAVEGYCLMQSHGDIGEFRESVRLKRQFGRETYHFVRKCLNLEDITEQEINEFADRSFIPHRAKNWASMMVDLTYFGLMDQCYAILEKNGLEKGQQELIGLARSLKDDSTANTFFKEIGEKSKRVTMRMKPIRENLVTKGLFEYRKDAENYIRAEFSGPKKDGDTEKCEFFPAIKNRFVEKYKEELDSRGQLWMNVWGNEIIFGGYE